MEEQFRGPFIIPQENRPTTAEIKIYVSLLIVDFNKLVIDFNKLVKSIIDLSRIYQYELISKLKHLFI